MGITVKGDEALKLLELLEKMDKGYRPTDEELGYLYEIGTLDFSGMVISSLPTSIGRLLNLQALDLSRTFIHILPVSIGNLTNLQSLDLFDTPISFLPDTIGKLINLNVLKLSNTEINNLPDTIGNLTNLNILKLSDTPIHKMPDTIWNLLNLQKLDLSNTQIDKLPDFIGGMSNLQSLKLFCTPIKTLPDSIGCLTSLQVLNLFGTPINTLPDSIGSLTCLQELDLTHSKVSTLPDSIGNLSNLRSLKLYNTLISSLPNTIGNLTSLQTLWLSYTKVVALPYSIGKLTNLRTLNLSSTPISFLPDSIGYLPNLRTLSLDDTPICNLPDSIGNLTNLRLLSLSGLHLQQVPPKILNLGLDFTFSASKRGINLDNTTLATQPISLFHQPLELIQAYYDAPKVTINDAKVIFLGDGGVGKTRTIKRLLNGGEPGDYPTELTPGIEITDYPTTYDDHPVDIRFWDFGGQEIMHAMHRCFLTDRTCYVVMVSNRFGNRTQRARYWLKTIDSFAKDCPVILAVNLWDTDEGIDGVNGELLEQEFRNLKKIITYSAKGSDKDHFNRLTEAIAEQANRLDSCGMEFPESWANICADLSKRAEKDRYISKADYLSICAKNGETDPQICGWLLEWFNDLGVCFSYHTDKTSGQELEDYQVLDPRWLVNAVYLIINKGNHEGKIERRTTKDGTISLEHIQDLLEKGGGTAPGMQYTEQECDYILNVMWKFRLSYPVDEESEFIPALCPDQWKKAPQTEGWDSHVTYEMRYKYLPDSVLHQLMIYGKEKRLLEQAWSSGMELRYKMDALSAVVRLDGDAPVLRMEVYAAAGEKPWELLEKLRSELERINNDLNLEAEDVIVIKTDKQTAHFPVAAVLKAVERGKPSTLYAMDGGELEEYRVDEILGAAFDMDKVDKEKEKAKEENRPMSEKNMSGGNTYITNNYYGDNNGDQYNNSTVYTSKDAKELVQQFITYLERRDEKAEALLTSLMADLRKSQEPAVQELVAEVDDTAKKKGLVPSFIGAFGKALEVGANVATFAPFISQYAPQIASAANTAANTLSGFLK